MTSRTMMFLVLMTEVAAGVCVHYQLYGMAAFFGLCFLADSIAISRDRIIQELRSRL